MNSENGNDGTDVSSLKRHWRTKAASHNDSWKAYHVPLAQSGLGALNVPPLAPGTFSGRRVSPLSDLSLLLWHCQRGKAHQATLHIQPKSRKEQRGAGFSEERSHITTHLSTSFSNRSSACLATKGSGWSWLACWGSSRCCPTTNAPVSHTDSSSPYTKASKGWSDTSESTVTCVLLVCTCLSCLLKEQFTLKMEILSKMYTSLLHYKHVWLSSAEHKGQQSSLGCRNSMLASPMGKAVGFYVSCNTMSWFQTYLGLFKV